MMALKKHLYILLLLSISCWSFAQELPQIKHFLPSDYNAQLQNWSLAFHPKGILYTANNAGLLEFDGSKWNTYTLPGGGHIRTVNIASNGEIFTGGFAEFGKWIPDNSGILQYHSLSKYLNPKAIGHEEIWNIVVKDSIVWFQSWGKLFRYDGKKTTPIKAPGSMMFVHIVENKLLLQIIDQGLYELSANGNFTLIPGSEFLATERVNAISPAGDGFLVATNSNILYCDGIKFTVWNPQLISTLSQDQINKLIRLKSGQYAVGTIRNGLFLLDKNGSVLLHINQNSGLQNNTILFLCEDNSGHLWIGLDQGIDCVHLGSPLRFAHTQDGAIGTTYCAIVHNGTLYIGTNQGLYSKNWSTSDLSTQKLQLIKGSQGQVWELAEYGGKLLIGHNQGTFTIENGNFKKVAPNNGGWSIQRHPSDPNVLIQGHYTGLQILHFKGSTWEYQWQVANFSEPVNQIEFISENQAFAVSPYRGVYHLTFDPLLKRVLKAEPIRQLEGIPLIYHVHLSRWNKQVWLQSQGNLFIWKQNKWVHQSQALRPGKNIGGLIIPSSNGDFFFYEKGNLTRLKAGGEQERYKLKLVTDYEKVITLPDQNLLFCLEQGYAVLPPFTFKAPASFLAKPILTLFTYGTNKLIPFRINSTNQLARPIYSGIPLTWEFSNPGQISANKYRCRILGWNDQWSAWLDENRYIQPSLPPGQYTFEVVTESGISANMPFEVNPRWYQTIWAQLLLFLFILSSLVLLWKWQEYRLRLQRQKLEAEKTKELQAQKTAAKNKQLQIELENKSHQLASSTAHLVQRNSFLQQLQDELMNIKKDIPSVHYLKLKRLIDSNLEENEEDWLLFETGFNEVHNQFLNRLKKEFPDLTPSELRLAAYLKMNLSSKEIAHLLNISVRGVENKRYRLRRKLDLGNDDNLTEFMMKF